MKIKATIKIGGRPEQECESLVNNYTQFWFAAFNRGTTVPTTDTSGTARALGPYSEYSQYGNYSNYSNWNDFSQCD